MALQINESNKKLSAEHSKSLAKEKAFIVYPTEIHQLQQGILTYVQLLQLVFGPKSYITAQVKTWYEHIQSNHTHYNNLAFSKQTLPSQIAMTIQSSVAAFLTDCNKEQDLSRVNMDFIDFSKDQYNIMTQTFHFHLSHEILAKINSTASPSTLTPTSSRRHPAPTPSPAHNTRPQSRQRMMPNPEFAQYLTESRYYN